MSARRITQIATQLQTAAVAEKSTSSPVFAKLGSIDRYKYITGKEPLIQGLWPAFITPLTADGEVDVAAVKPLCDYLIDECGVHGLYACGGTGEMRSLTAEARKTMCAATCEAVAGRVPVVVCVGETVDTAEAVDLAAHAKSVGADGLSSTVPVWALDDPNLLQLTVDLYTALGGVGLPLYACASRPSSLTHSRLQPNRAPRAGVPGLRLRSHPCPYRCPKQVLDRRHQGRLERSGLPRRHG